jgi:hypothetical protein
MSWRRCISSILTALPVSKMKDRLGKSRWANLPIKNRTQNYLTRFTREPGGEWFDRGIKDSERKFKTILNRALKTHYSEIMDDF